MVPASAFGEESVQRVGLVSSMYASQTLQTGAYVAPLAETHA